MQPYLFPYIGYFQLINSVDQFVILNDVNFIVRGWINRNYIQIYGKKHLFTVPLDHVSQNKKIIEIKISEQTNWRKDLLLTFKYAYHKAPYFNNIFPLLDSVFLGKYKSISDMVTTSLRKVSEYLDIKAQFKYSYDYDNHNLKGQYRIVDICKREKADMYINLPGGVNLYDKNVFIKNNLSLKFIKPNPVIYNQFNKEFIPNLSLLDMMMFNNKSMIKKMLNNFVLE